MYSYNQIANWGQRLSKICNEQSDDKFSVASNDKLVAGIEQNLRQILTKLPLGRCPLVPVFCI